MYFGLLQVNPPAEDDTLPLQLFRLDGTVLVAVPEWHLTTAAAAERIAVERVLRDKPAAPEEATAQAWMALDTRLQQVVEYLSTTVGTTPTPEQLELWRQVQGLLVQAHLLRAQTTTSANTNPILPQQVAVLAKTVDSIAWYTDKFRLVHEGKGKTTAASLLDPRRF